MHKRGLTVSSVELGVVGSVGARGLGRALEGRVRQHGQQGAVAVICKPKHRGVSCARLRQLPRVYDSETR